MAAGKTNPGVETTYGKYQSLGGSALSRFGFRQLDYSLFPLVFLFGIVLELPSRPSAGRLASRCEFCPGLNI